VSLGVTWRKLLRTYQHNKHNEAWWMVNGEWWTVNGRITRGGWRHIVEKANSSASVDKSVKLSPSTKAFGEIKDDDCGL
jgi:hypothetical protein